jgi:hypothetical protein
MFASGNGTNIPDVLTAGIQVGGADSQPPSFGMLCSDCIEHLLGKGLGQYLA